MLSTDGELPPGTPVKAGDHFEVRSRSVLVIQAT